jgi:hypothetical protein
MDMIATIDETPAQVDAAIGFSDAPSFDPAYFLETLATAANTTNVPYNAEDLRQIYCAAVKLELQERARFPSFSYAARNALRLICCRPYVWDEIVQHHLFYVRQDWNNFLAGFLRF